MKTILIIAALMLAACSTTRMSYPEGHPIVGDVEIQSLASKCSTNPKCAYDFAFYIKKGRWPKGEEAIASDKKYSDLYAKNIIKGPWPPKYQLLGGVCSPSECPFPPEYQLQPGDTVIQKNPLIISSPARADEQFSKEALSPSSGSLTFKLVAKNNKPVCSLKEIEAYAKAFNNAAKANSLLMENRYQFHPNKCILSVIKDNKQTSPREGHPPPGYGTLPHEGPSPPGHVFPISLLSRSFVIDEINSKPTYMKPIRFLPYRMVMKNNKPVCSKIEINSYVKAINNAWEYNTRMEDSLKPYTGYDFIPNECFKAVIVDETSK